MDQLLTNVLGLYQDVHDHAHTEQILSSTTHLLTRLTNPLNVSLLTSHLLTAPAVWQPRRPGPGPVPVPGPGASNDGLVRTCYRVISIFNTAAVHVRRDELDRKSTKADASLGQVQPFPDDRDSHAPRLASHAWAKAVLQGLDDRSSRWRHLLVLTGVLMGLDTGGRRPDPHHQPPPPHNHPAPAQQQQHRQLAEPEPLPRGLRGALEEAVVTATNLAVHDPSPTTSSAITTTTGTATTRTSPGVALALSFVFPLLSQAARSRLDYDALLPVVVAAILFSPEGLNEGFFLGAIGPDVQPAASGRMAWLETAPSFVAIRQMENQPLIVGLGPLSRTAAHGIEHAKDPRAVMQAQDHLLAFTERLLCHWGTSGLADVELSEPAVVLTGLTSQATWPVLWRLLKNTMYSVVVMLQAMTARSLLDRHLGGGHVAATVAAKSLHIFRNLFFISSLQGSNAFQAYTFTYLASIDRLAQNPDACVAFIQSIKPAETPGAIPPCPLRRTFDLFYLSLAEHVPLSLSPEACEALIIQPATIYLGTFDDSIPSNLPALSPATAAHGALVPLPHASPRMVELFEAAHSAILSALSCPRNAPVTARLAPFYADALFSAFPSRVSPRQFRLAFTTLMQILSPPFPLSATHPDLAETLLEMVRQRAVAIVGGAGTAPLVDRLPTPPPPSSPSRHQTAPAPLSEQATLVLAMIDSLPFLHPAVVEEWMTLAAGALHRIREAPMREAVQRRFWEVLSSGEMDMERATLGVAWWGTKGGREMVLFGHGVGVGASGGEQKPFEPMMRGAIVSRETPGSRL